MGFKINCESVFIFSSSFILFLKSWVSIIVFQPLHPPSTCLISCSLLKLPQFSAPFHFHPPHARLCCLATSPHLQTDDVEKSSWYPSIYTNCTLDKMLVSIIIIIVQDKLKILTLQSHVLKKELIKPIFSLMKSDMDMTSYDIVFFVNSSINTMVMLKQIYSV